jgi:arginyl-tRNA synthetase
MISIEITLQNVIKQAFIEIFNKNIEEVVLQDTKKEFEGTHTFVVFPFTKELQQKPQEIAQKIGDFVLKNTGIVEKFNVIQGFLNFSIKKEIWAAIFDEIYQQKDFGKQPQKNEKIVVEYSSPNTNKPLHLGHLRNNFLGYSLAQILTESGFEVHKTQIINDRGIHICKSMLMYQKNGNNQTPESENIKGDHLIGKYYVDFDKIYKQQIKYLIEQGKTQNEAEKQAPAIIEAQNMLLKWEQNDPETVALWKKMNSWVYAGFEVTYKAIGVDFDSFYYESNTYLLGKDIVEEGLQKGVFYKKEDNSVWIDLTPDGLDEKLVLRGNGTSVYLTQDLGTADLREKDQKMNRLVYVVGNEQEYHFKVLFLILKKLGRAYAEGLHHLSYGMVELPAGRGKMKTREGTVVDADDLVKDVIEIAQNKTLEKLGSTDGFTENELQELFKTIGLGALKYFLLKIDPAKRMVYNPEESIRFEGDAAPFIQYTHARTKSVLRKATEMNIQYNNQYKDLQPLEIDLIQQITKFPKALQLASETYSPYIIAQYVYELTQVFNSFYAKYSILKAETEQEMCFRIGLCEKVAFLIKKSMRLLGANVPEKM